VTGRGEKVFDTIEAEPDRLRGVTGIGPVRAKRITDAWLSRTEDRAPCIRRRAPPGFPESFARMPVAPGLPLMLEGSRSRFAADQGETQEDLQSDYARNASGLRIALIIC
jgi:hypothetical protein